MDSKLTPEQFSGELNKFAMKIIFIVLIAIIGSSYYMNTRIISQLQETEYAKVGGKENYDLINQAQKLQIEQQIPQIKQFIAKNAGGTNTPAATTTTAQQPTTNTTTSTTGDVSKKTLSKDAIAAIKQDTYIEGAKNARITVVEYSDLECPYCKRQFDDKTISQLREKYPQDVQTIFKNNPLPFHANSKKESEALLCVGKIGGTKKYVSFYSKIFERTTSNGTGFSLDALAPLAEEIGINKTKFQECLDNNETSARLDSELQEGQNLGVTGTPGSIIIDNATGQYALISGAYPVSEFEKVIDGMLAAK